MFVSAWRGEHLADRRLVSVPCRQVCSILHSIWPRRQLRFDELVHCRAILRRGHPLTALVNPRRELQGGCNPNTANGVWTGTSPDLSNQGFMVGRAWVPRRRDWAVNNGSTSPIRLQCGYVYWDGGYGQARSGCNSAGGGDCRGCRCSCSCRSPRPFQPSTTTGPLHSRARRGTGSATGHRARAGRAWVSAISGKHPVFPLPTPSSPAHCRGQDVLLQPGQLPAVLRQHRDVVLVARLLIEWVKVSTGRANEAVFSPPFPPADCGCCYYCATCGNSYTFSYPGVSCNACDPATGATYGSVTPTLQPGASQYTWRCASGFYGTPTTRSCTANGGWTTPAISCSVCNPPSVFPNGQITQPTATTWTYTCYSGFVSSSVTTITCNPDTGLSTTTVNQCSPCPVGTWACRVCFREVLSLRPLPCAAHALPRSKLLNRRREPAALPARHVRRPGPDGPRLRVLLRQLPRGLLVRRGLDVGDAEPVWWCLRLLPRRLLRAHPRLQQLLHDARRRLDDAAHGAGAGLSEPQQATPFPTPPPRPLLLPRSTAPRSCPAPLSAPARAASSCRASTSLPRAAPSRAALRRCRSGSSRRASSGARPSPSRRPATRAP